MSYPVQIFSLQQQIHFPRIIRDDDEGYFGGGGGPPTIPFGRTAAPGGKGPSPAAGPSNIWKVKETFYFHARLQN